MILAWLGAVWHFWECSFISWGFSFGASFPAIVDFGFAGAGLTLCIGLIQKKSSALPKARLLLLITAGWSLVHSVARIFMNEIPEIRTSTLAFVGVVGVIALGIAVNLVLWKIWSSKEAAKYANA